MRRCVCLSVGMYACLSVCQTIDRSTLAGRKTHSDTYRHTFRYVRHSLFAYSALVVLGISAVSPLICRSACLPICLPVCLSACLPVYVTVNDRARCRLIHICVCHSDRTLIKACSCLNGWRDCSLKGHNTWPNVCKELFKVISNEPKEKPNRFTCTTYL